RALVLLVGHLHLVAADAECLGVRMVEAGSDAGERADADDDADQRRDDGQLQRRMAPEPRAQPVEQVAEERHHLLTAPGSTARGCGSRPRWSSSGWRAPPPAHRP